MKFLGHGNFKFGNIEESIDSGRWLQCAAGIDVHKHTAIATVMIPNFKMNELKTLTQKFGTSYSALQKLCIWFCEFKKYGLECFGIEATSTYYRPIEYALTKDFKQVLINPYLLKEKRKSDVKDSRTIAYVVLTGLFKPSYVMPDIQQLLKTINRRILKEYGKRTSASNAIGTTLTNYNILLANEIKILSASGKQILCAITEGETIPEKAVNRAVYYRPKQKHREHRQKALKESLTALPGLPSSVRLTLSSLYNSAIFHEKQIELYSKELKNLMAKYEVKLPATGKVITALDATKWLITIPGVSLRYAETFVAEMGIDMRRFPTAKHAISYAGFNPEKRISADKVTSAGTPSGNEFIHSITVQIAQGLLQGRKSDNELARWGRDYKARNGNTIAAHNRAVSAVGRRIVYISWILLSKGEPYCPSGYNFDAKKKSSDKKIDQLSKHVGDIKSSVVSNDLSEVSKAKSLEIINTIGQMLGLNTSFQIVPHMKDGKISELKGLSTRTLNILKKAQVDRVSVLIYHWVSQTLMQIKGFGNASYKEVVENLFENGFIVKTGEKK